MFHPHPVLPGKATQCYAILLYNALLSDHALSKAAFPLNPPKAETEGDSLLPCATRPGNSDEPVEAYYSGTEINGFMPHRGDFATVSACIHIL